MMASASPAALVELIKHVDKSPQGCELLQTLTQSLKEKNSEGWTGLHMMARHASGALLGLTRCIDSTPQGCALHQTITQTMKEKNSGAIVSRTENDLSFKTVIIGSIALVALMAVLPQIPGDSIINKLLIGVLVVVFGFFFVTVSSRIVGIIPFVIPESHA
jgi:hypothetical protein